MNRVVDWLRGLAVAAIILGPWIAVFVRHLYSRKENRVQARLRATRQLPLLRPALQQTEPATAHPGQVGSRPVFRVTGRLRICYHDQAGAETDRLISVRQARGFTTSKGVFVPDRFDAYCYTRKAGRTFLIAHVIEAIDAETGEVIDNLQAWVRARAHA